MKLLSGASPLACLLGACLISAALLPAAVAADTQKGVRTPSGSAPANSGASNAAGTAAPPPSPQTGRVNNGAGPLVTVVLANASAADALKLLSRVSEIHVELSPGTRTEALPLLSVVAQHEPFFILLQQIAMAEGLGVMPSQDGFELFSVQGRYSQQPAAASAAVGTSPSMGFGSGGFSSVPGPIPPVFPGEAGFSGPAAPAAHPRPSAAPLSPDGESTDVQSEQPRTEDLLQYVLSYVRSQGPGMPPPDQVFPALRTPAGSLKYVAVATEALSHLPGSAGPGNAAGAASSAVTRLRVLLSQAEEIHRRACLREQLQTEIIVLTQRLPRADPSMQPLLRTVLEHRQQQLADLER